MLKFQYTAEGQRSYNKLRKKAAQQAYVVSEA